MNPNPTFTTIAVNLIHPSKHNPRKHFDDAKLDELAQSIRTQGIIEPLLVRPLPRPLHQEQVEYEIVAGERRFRASKKAELKELPCLVRVLTDDQALEMQMVENLQRQDLSPIEEAQSYQALLELKDYGTVEGAADTKAAPRYSVEKLAERFGRTASSIYRALKLLRLPAGAMKAVEAGSLGVSVAILVGRIPAEGMRAEAAKAVQGLTHTAAKELIHQQFMVGLKGAPFDPADAALVPAAGSCFTCAKMSANCVELFDAVELTDLKKAQTCCDTACFRSKIAALRDRRAAEITATGAVVLDTVKSRKIFPEGGHWDVGEMAYGSGYVETTASPDSYHLRVAPTKAKPAPTWGELASLAESKVKGAKIKRVWIEDQKGVLRECIEKKMVEAAIEKSGEKVFADHSSSSGSRPKGPMSDKDKADRKKLIAKNKANREAVRDEVEFVLGRLAIKEELDEAVVMIVVRAAFGEHYSHKDHAAAVAKRLGIVLPKGFAADNLSWLEKLGSLHLLRLAAGCLAMSRGGWLTATASPVSEDLALLATGIGADGKPGKRVTVAKPEASGNVSREPGEPEPIMVDGKQIGTFTRAPKAKVAALDAGSKAVAAVKGSMPAKKKTAKGGKGK